MNATTTNILQRTVGELVAEDYRTATVFKRHGIDFCCGGGATLERVCAKKDLPVDDLVNALEQAVRGKASGNVRPDSWSAGFLADFIVNEHHGYVRESLPLLREFTTKVARVHGHHEPALVEIASLFEQIADEMSLHMEKEERVLFPYIKRLDGDGAVGDAVRSIPFGSVENPIRMMEDEHERVGSLMHQIRLLSNNYTPPEHACATYRVAFAKLEEFEDDLHRHVHLENNILFKKALALEGGALSL